MDTAIANVSRWCDSWLAKIWNRLFAIRSFHLCLYTYFNLMLALDVLVRLSWYFSNIYRSTPDNQQQNCPLFFTWSNILFFPVCLFTFARCDANRLKVLFFGCIHDSFYRFRPIKGGNIESSSSMLYSFVYNEVTFTLVGSDSGFYPLSLSLNTVFDTWIVVVTVVFTQNT